jgi:voltage-gated potassium channel
MTENLPPNSDREQENGGTRQFVLHANYEMFVAGLVIYQLVNSILWWFLRGDDSARVVIILSLVISLLMLVDFFYRLAKSPHKLRWFGAYYGFLLLIGSLPIPFISLARLIWYRLVIRRLKRTDMASFFSVIVEQRAQSALLAILFTALIVLEAGSIAVLSAEAGARGANIETAGDALWWSIVTIATVGYGDRYPVTAYGRVVGVFMMIVGVGVFSVMTSFLAQSFLKSRKVKVGKKLSKPVSSQSPQDSLKGIMELLDDYDQTHQNTLDQLRARVEELEERLKQ